MMVAAVMALQQVPALAQDNAAPPPVEAPAQGPVQGPTQEPAQEPTQEPTKQPPPGEQPSPPKDEASGSSDHGRFVFHPIANGFLRLDMATGAVASCTPAGTVWNCVAGRDERAALDREIARLQRDNAVLKNALLQHSVPLPDGMAPNPPAGAPGVASEEPIPRPPQTVPPTPAAPGMPAPSADSTFDHIVDAVEKGWRRLVEMTTNLRRDLEQ